MSPRDCITRNDSIPEESITAVMPVTQSQPERTRRLITVEVVCVLYACYFGMMFPLQSQYVYRRINEQNLNNKTINITEGNCTTPNYSSPSYKHGQQSRSEASLTMAYINLAQMIPVVFTTLFMGSYSDRTGRKFPMILPIIGAIVHSILTCLVIGLNLPLPLLTVGAFLDGISGGSATLFMVVFSYTADISSTERRTIRMVVAEICIGSGAVVSSFATGVVIEKLGFFYSFFIVIGFNLLNLLYIIFLIKETLPRQEDSKFFSCRHLRGTLNVYTDGSVPGRRYRLIICLVILFIVCAVQIGRPDAETYFLIGAPFCWSSILIGTYSSTLYLIGSVSSLLTTWLLEHVAGTLFLMFLGSISGVALETIFAFSRTKLHVFLCTLAGNWSFIIIPMIRATSSKLVHADEQGAMFAGISCIQAVSTCVGAVGFDVMYSSTVNLFSGITFLVMAGCFLLSALFALVLIFASWHEKRKSMTYQVLLAD